MINPEEIQPAGGEQGGPAQGPAQPHWLHRLRSVNFYSDSQQGRAQAPSSWPGRQPPLLAVGLSSSGSVDAKYLYRWGPSPTRNAGPSSLSCREQRAEGSPAEPGHQLVPKGSRRGHSHTKGAVFS